MEKILLVEDDRDIAELAAREFPYNEVRGSWKCGGLPLVTRLKDKAHAWTAWKGRQAQDVVIPQVIAAGLVGCPYVVADMVGGGLELSFVNATIDETLFVRSAALQTLMPMMQFSLAPWRVLDKEHYSAVLKAVGLRSAMLPLIQSLFERAARTGEPIVSPLEYVFPGEGLAAVKDEFMLGERLLVAPMQDPGTRRTVVLPAGQWKADDGRIYEGGTHEIDVPLDRIPIFEKM